MRFTATLYLLCSLLATAATAFAKADSASALSCMMAIEHSNLFNCSGNKRCLCSIPDFFGVVVECVEKSGDYSPAVKSASFDFLARKCRRYNKITANDVDSYSNQYQVRTKSRLVKRENSFNMTYWKPIGVAILQNHYDSARFGWSMNGFLLAVLVLRTITNFAQHTMTRMLNKLDTPFTRKLRKHLLLSPAWKKRHSEPFYFHGFSFNIPTRDVSLIIVFLFLFNFVVMFFKYGWNFYLLPGYHGLRLARYVGDRAGIIAVTMVPSLYLFGGRNNFLLWITGWPLDTFNALHKWIGRLIIIDLSVHSLCWLLYYLIDSISVPNEWKEAYYIAGNIAFIGGLIIFFQGMHYFRALNYELFLFIHIVCALMFTVGAWYHLNTLGEMDYIYATCAVWAFDRAARIARILFSGVTSKAEIKKWPGDVFEVKISYSGRWKFYPGCYIFIHFVRWNRWWQNHPFTLIESPKECDNGKLVLFCKAKKGLTKHTLDFLESFERGETTMTVWVEGPYGTQHPIYKYDTAVMIAGGIGISGIYTYALDLMKRATNQRIILVWVVSDSHPLVWFKSYLDAICLDSRFDVRIYVKQCPEDIVEGQQVEDGKRGNEVISEKITTSVSSSFSDDQSSNISIYYNKPSITKIITEIMLDEGNGVCGFLVCGPGAMNDEVRNSVRNSLADAKHRADFFEESFSW